MGALLKNKQRTGAAGAKLQSCWSCLYPSWAAMGSGSHPALGTGTTVIPQGYPSALPGPAPSTKGWCLQNQQGWGTPASRFTSPGPRSLQTLSFSAERGWQMVLLHLGNRVPARTECNRALGTSGGHAVLPGLCWHPVHQHPRPGGLSAIACDGASADFSNYSCEGRCVQVSCG